MLRDFLYKLLNDNTKKKIPDIFIYQRNLNWNFEKLKDVNKTDVNINFSLSFFGFHQAACLQVLK